MSPLSKQRTGCVTREFCFYLPPTLAEDRLRIRQDFVEHGGTIVNWSQVSDKTSVIVVPDNHLPSPYLMATMKKHEIRRWSPEKVCAYVKKRHSVVGTCPAHIASDSDRESGEDSDASTPDNQESFEEEENGATEDSDRAVESESDESDEDENESEVREEAEQEGLEDEVERTEAEDEDDAVHDDQPSAMVQMRTLRPRWWERQISPAQSSKRALEDSSERSSEVPVRKFAKLDAAPILLDSETVRSVKVYWKAICEEPGPQIWRWTRNPLNGRPMRDVKTVSDTIEKRAGTWFLKGVNGRADREIILDTDVSERFLTSYFDSDLEHSWEKAKFISDWAKEKVGATQQHIRKMVGFASTSTRGTIRRTKDETKAENDWNSEASSVLSSLPSYPPSVLSTGLGSIIGSWSDLDTRFLSDQLRRNVQVPSASTGSISGSEHGSAQRFLIEVIPTSEAGSQTPSPPIVASWVIETLKKLRQRFPNDSFDPVMVHNDRSPVLPPIAEDDDQDDSSEVNLPQLCWDLRIRCNDCDSLHSPTLRTFFTFETTHLKSAKHRAIVEERMADTRGLSNKVVGRRADRLQGDLEKRGMD